MGMVTQTSIDGFRLIADRSDKYEGQVGPFWCGGDGLWKDVWLGDKAPSAAKVGVKKQNFSEPLFAVALFKTYAQTKKDNTLIGVWASGPELMIAKCAEALALRRAFPQELSGLYTGDEMSMAEEVQVSKEEPKALSQKKEQPKALNTNKEEQIKKILEAFKQFGVERIDLEQDLGKKLEEMNEGDAKRLQESWRNLSKSRR